ncbi:hypothetical protein HanRHA438_Chr02g0052901 [Helianthus annuus]|nr:hypothetical protein HanRHA438_Chr02g0052901 [Helianthus annuus]
MKSIVRSSNINSGFSEKCTGDSGRESWRPIEFGLMAFPSDTVTSIQIIHVNILHATK